MMDSAGHNEQIGKLARQSLDAFSKIADDAKSSLSASFQSDGVTALAYPNSLYAQEASRNVQNARRGNHEVYRKLAQEPAVARVVIKFPDGKELTLYICRATPDPVDGLILANYRSPVGRLASLDIGDNGVYFRDGQKVSVRIQENAQFHPLFGEDGWDSRNSELKGENYGTLIVESLRALRSEIDPSLLDDLLSEESRTEKIRKGVYRDVLKGMTLRDQPVLDKFQDELFRLPLDSRIMILGAPGTGKTTTLIRRLGQKLDPESLTEDEKLMAGSETAGTEADHSQSWIMFTPTELLQIYVKEAFNREGIPAPDERIRTWPNFRRHLARNRFNILRSHSGTGSYVMRESNAILREECSTDSIAWYEDFDDWQKSEFLAEMLTSAKSLSENPSEEINRLGGNILSMLGSFESKLQPDIFASLATVREDIQNLVKTLKDSTDRSIRGALNLQVNKDRRFLDDLVSEIEKMSGEREVAEDPDSDSDDEEEEAVRSAAGRAGAERDFMRAVRARARARARVREVNRKSRNARLLEWLGDRTLPDEELQEVGERLLLQSSLGRFANPAHRYVIGIPARYRRFRRDRQRRNRWYRSDGFESADIHPLEADLVLLAMMRGAHGLIRRVRSLVGSGRRETDIFSGLQDLYRTQVLVDEATDFSPVQLACMAVLARPDVRSLFACGDFNQRITDWGTKSTEELKWAIPGIDVREISIPYRQSKHLQEFARRIVQASGGDARGAVIPVGSERDGLPPVLATFKPEKSEIAVWLARRIREIEDSLEVLPSVAVLVNSEEEVDSVANALGDALEERNIRVVACLRGEVGGRPEDVRVFSVEHIKGLEFEAVFFIGIDRLAETFPDLFDKFLYVGATRAATYLGITCERDLPPLLAELRGLFGEKFQ